MATVVLKASDRFPVGTTANVYALPAYSNAPTGVPTSASVTSAVVAADGSLTFTGLTEGQRYGAYAQVGGQDRWVQIRPDTPKGLGTTPGQDTTIGNATGKVGFFGGAGVTRPAAIAAPTAPSAAYSQAEAQSMKTAVDAIRAALTNLGLTS